MVPGVSTGAAELGGQGGQMPTQFLGRVGKCPPSFWSGLANAQPVFGQVHTFHLLESRAGRARGAGRAILRYFFVGFHQLWLCKFARTFAGKISYFYVSYFIVLLSGLKIFLRGGGF